MIGVTVLDFETYYDQDYTLKKLTTEEYVRDPRFQAHLCGIWTPERGYEVYSKLSHDLLYDYIVKRTVICQKAQFDGLILSDHFGLRPANWVCTLSMARALLPQLKSHNLDSLAAHYGLPAKTIDYNAFKGMRDLDAATCKALVDGCLHDVALTKQIAERLLAEFPKSELPVIDATIRMFTEPTILLDAPMAQVELDRIKTEKTKALYNLKVTREELQSSAKFSQLLNECGVETPTKPSPRVPGKMIPAIAKNDQEMKDLMEHGNPRVAALAAARLGEKSTLMETRLERLISMSKRGPLCLYLNYAGAGNTLRWSGGDKINAQNFPPAIQKALVAPAGYKFVKTDSAQIECRLLNYFAGQDDVVHMFASGKDVYAENASKYYGRQITKADKAERFLFKVLELSCGYGTGWAKAQKTLAQGAMGGDPVHLTEEQARSLIASYRDSHPQVVKLWKKYDKWLADMMKLPPGQRQFNLPNGMSLNWSQLRYDGADYYRGDQKVYGALVVENIIQALGRVLIAEIIVRVKKLHPEYRLVLCTHDDTVHLVPEKDDSAANNISRQFLVPPAWAPGLPLGVDSYEGKRYA